MAIVAELRAEDDHGLRAEADAPALVRRHRTIWRWRIYRIFNHRKGGWKAESLMSLYPLPDVPAEFWWPNEHDIDGLKEYIDAVLRGNETEALKFVDRGQVREIILHPRAEFETYNVSARVLLDFLLLRGSISVPINGILRLYSADITNENGEKETVYATSDFLGALAPLLEERDQKLAQAMWRREYPNFSSDQDVLIHTAMYASTDPDSAGSSSAASINAPPKEREIERQVFNEWVSLITEVEQSGTRYYVRRIYQLQDAKLIYAATAWELVGPWQEHHRDNERLMALRVPV